ncbi:hypothetical protein NE237_008694 [Protea cynaroides]|uniref:KIB1-4 beta-propeller domain-containing protein n=1 Tax=Protea cynaroides TaxID=273540 RepID=A0A9Q0KWI9_9MAGN|nr:hypothetical protein NE237_008694 [Protea cynaroides]
MLRRRLKAEHLKGHGKQENRRKSIFSKRRIHSTLCSYEKRNGMGNWSDLDEDILRLIIDKFWTIEDIVCFGAVCQSWRSVSVEKRQQQQQLCPWLMLAEREGSDRRGFYSLSTQKVYHMNLPGARGRRCWFSHGWLITFGVDLEMHLLNPFSQVQIPLPPQSTLPHQYSPESKFSSPEELLKDFIRKVVLSSRPSLSVKTTHCEANEDEKCVIMAISSKFNTLAFSRLGDKVWTAIEGEIAFRDTIYFKGQFYGVHCSGRLFICDICSPQPKTIEFSSSPLGILKYDNSFLVESLGELFMVGQEIHDDFDLEEDNEDYLDDDYSDSGEDIDNYSDLDEYPSGYGTTKGFDVYKFNFDNRKWMQVKSLENCAFFVGNNTSLAIFPSNQYPGCEPNCIYFTDSSDQGSYYETSGHDMGVFRMDTRKIQPHYVGLDIFSRICNPLWVGL